MDASSHRFRDVDPPGYAARFHEPRGVDRVPPDIECKPAVADDPGKDRSGMYSDTQFQCGQPDLPALSLDAFDSRLHLQRRHANVDGMPPVVRERAGHGHIGIPDGLYLLQSVPRTDVVERR